jgi:beta-galactosidase
VTVNELGKGRAYYLASWNEEPFLEDFYRALAAALPRGVGAALRRESGRLGIPR